MAKELPLLDKIYKDPLYQEICRFVHYKGCLYRDLRKKLDLLGEAYGKVKAESAQSHLVTYADQFTTNPKPLAEVKLRAEVRKYVFQLLGPAPEQEDWFYRNQDGTLCGCPRPNREEPKAEPQMKSAKKPAAKKEPAKAAAKKPARKKQKA